MKFAYNYVLACAVLSWAAAQLIKALLYCAKNNKFKFERLLGSGGMPSSHSSFVCSALIAVSRKTGVASVEFAITFLITAVVIYDAMGVRYAAGLHAREINKMNRYLEDINESSQFGKLQVDKNKKELKEFLGHTPLEVIAGIILGIAIAFAVPIK